MIKSILIYVFIIFSIGVVIPDSYSDSNTNNSFYEVSHE